MRLFRKKQAEHPVLTNAVDSAMANSLARAKFLEQHPEILELPLERQLSPYLGRVAPPISFASIERLCDGVVGEADKRYGDGFQARWVQAQCDASLAVILMLLGAGDQAPAVLSQPKRECSIEGLRRAMAVAAVQIGRAYYKPRSTREVLGLSPNEFVADAANTIDRFGGVYADWLAAKAVDAPEGGVTEDIGFLIALNLALWAPDVSEIPPGTTEAASVLRSQRITPPFGDLGVLWLVSFTVQNAVIGEFAPRLDRLLRT